MNVPKLVNARFFAILLVLTVLLGLGGYLVLDYVHAPAEIPDSLIALGSALLGLSAGKLGDAMTKCVEGQIGTGE